MVHGEIWTVKDLFVYPNEYIYWAIQIVLYPYMTGLVAGAFVLSSLYHVFGITQLRNLARFALVFSLALLFVAPMPLLLHLQQPARGVNVLLTPHFTSAIAAFGIVFISYGTLVASEIWFLYRPHIVRTALRLRATQRKSLGQWLAYLLFSVLTLGAYDLSAKALHWDERAIKVLAIAGIPLASFLHGYAGFIFGSVKANALWMTPLMPVIFIVSAIVSGIALSLLTYIVVMETRKFFATRRARRGALATSPDQPESREQIASVEIAVVRTAARYLLDLPGPRDQPRAARPRLPELHGGEVLGRPARRDLRKGRRQHLLPAVRHREPGAPRPAALAPSERAPRGPWPASDPVRRLHDALERRDRRPGVLPLVRGLHALRHADHPPRPGDLQRGTRRRAAHPGHALHLVLAAREDIPGVFGGRG